jgi:WD40 repeat protein
MSATVESHGGVILVTAGHDHTIRFWDAQQAICYRTLQYAESVRIARKLSAPNRPMLSLCVMSINASACVYACMILTISPLVSR